MTLASFVVIAHCEERGIARTLESILAQRAPGIELEVVVVDDASTDATVAIVSALAERHPELRLVALPVNLGRGGARARGIEETRGALVATVDADIVLPPGWLAACVEALADADVVGGTAVPDGDVAYVHRRFGLEATAAPHTIPVSASNALYVRAALDACRFDPALRDGEDVALNHALAAAGFRLRGIEGLLVRHEEWKSFRQSVGWLFVSGKVATRQLARYGEIRQPDLAAAGGWGLVGLGVVAALRGRPAALLALPAYLVLLAGLHLRGKFALGRARPAAAAGAIGTDALLLGAYIAGRAAGLGAFRHRHDHEGPR